MRRRQKGGTAGESAEKLLENGRQDTSELKSNGGCCQRRRSVAVNSGVHKGKRATYEEKSGRSEGWPVKRPQDSCAEDTNSSEERYVDSGGRRENRTRRQKEGKILHAGAIRRSTEGRMLSLLCLKEGLMRSRGRTAHGVEKVGVKRIHH